jgi:hypothetical protein
VLRERERAHEEVAPNLGIWGAILAWAQRKREDIGKEKEYGRDQQEVLEILRGIEHGATAVFAGGWIFAPDPNGIQQSIEQAIEQEYGCLCQHPTSHTDGVGRMPLCCIRKHLFNEMLEALPKIPYVRKRLEHLAFKKPTQITQRILEVRKVLQLRKFELVGHPGQDLPSIFLDAFKPSQQEATRIVERCSDDTQ